MSDLSPRDRELVALGAAMGSNCVPCIEFHIPEARKAGLSDSEIHQAIVHADKIRQVPARKTLQTAQNLLGVADNTTAVMSNMKDGCSSLAQSACAAIQFGEASTLDSQPRAGGNCC